MGRCSASDIWDDIAPVILKSETIANLDKIELLEVLINSLLNYDWDCYGEDDSWFNPLTQLALKRVDEGLWQDYQEIIEEEDALTESDSEGSFSD